MANIFSFAFSLSFFLAAHVVLAENNKVDSTMTTVKNGRPIVGVLLLDSWDNKTQFIPSSYVKWAEMGGARVVPIPVARSRAYYSALFNQINGVIMPGGGAPLVGSLYADAAEIVLQTAEAKFAAGVFWPVWATCLSFEKLITYYSGNSLAWKSKCHVRDISLPLDFPADLDLRNVRLLKDAPASFIELLKTQNVTANLHSVCIDVETFKKNSNLTSQFRLVSTNRYLSIENGPKKKERQFVSTIEHRKFPIYGVQWHPEKAAFEWSGVVGSTFAHDEAAVLVGQYFANFFVGEARKNGQFFDSAEEERIRLVYAHSASLVYSPTALHQEQYVFALSWPDKEAADGGNERGISWTLIILMAVAGFVLVTLFLILYIVPKNNGQICRSLRQ